MDRRPCSKCGKRYSTEADRCPHCGEPSPTPGSEYIFRSVIVAGCCIVLFLIAFSVFAVIYIGH